MGDFPGATPFALSTFHSFSKDGKWYARITHSGEAFVWNLEGKQNPDTFLPVKLGAREKTEIPPVSGTFNGEFMDSSTRLVVFFANGWARYWELQKDGTWDPQPREVDLKVAAAELLKKQKPAASVSMKRLMTNKRGTHALLILEDPSSAVLFDGNEFPSAPGKNPKGRLLSGWSDKDTAVFNSPPLFVQVHHHKTSKYLIACFPPIGNLQQGHLRIWDLTPKVKRYDLDYKSFQPRLFSESILEVTAAESLAFTRSGYDVIRFVKLGADADHAEKLRGLDGPAQVFAHAPGGRWLVAGGVNGQVRAWNLANLSPDNAPKKSFRELRQEEVARMSEEGLRKDARAVIGRNLSKADRRLLFGESAKYEPTFEGLPEYEEPYKDFLRVLQGKFGHLFEPKRDTLAEAPELEFERGKKRAKEYPVRLQQGNTYVIDMRSTEIDSYLVLKDAKGNEEASDDDGGGYPNARIRYACKKTGDYTIVATTFRGGVGGFDLTALEFQAIPPIDLGELSGNKGYQGTLLPDASDTGDGPGVVYTATLPRDSTCQLDLESASFASILRLEQRSGDKNADAVSVGGKARIVLNTTSEDLPCRIVVIGTRGTAGPFTLRVQPRQRAR